MPLPQRCLVLDADQEWRETFEELLTSMGVTEVRSTAPDPDWPQIYNSFAPSLVILDIPESDSDQRIAQIPAIAKSGTKVIAISSAAKRTMVLDCINKGAIHFIVKGNDLELVEVSLESCLKRTQFTSKRNPNFAAKQVSGFMN